MNKILSIEESFTKIKPRLEHIIIDLKNSDTWKIKLTIAINFISTKDVDEERVMHSKSDNMEIMINDKADEVILIVFIYVLQNKNKFESW